MLPGIAPVAEAIRSTAGGVRIDVRVTPRASRTRVEGVREGRLLVRVTAPPVDSAANDAVVEAIAGYFDVPRRAVRIVMGGSGRNKTVDVDGVTAAAAAARLDAAGARGGPASG